MTNAIDERQMQIERLQNNLCSIRKIAGWTAEVLGEKIKTTKQTISNLENKKTPMNLAQYIAIRAALDLEIENNKENEILPKVVYILLDSSDELDEKDYLEVQDATKTAAVSIAGGISHKKLIPIFLAVGATGSIVAGIFSGAIKKLPATLAELVKKMIK